MIKYRDLKKGDYIWVVYNKNWEKDIPSQYKYAPSDYQLEKCIVNFNNLNEPRTIDHSSPWEESDPHTFYEHRISINFHGINYSRFYTDHYDEYKHMPMSPEYNDHGPWIEVFPNYEWAKEYLIARCNHEINGLKQNIAKEQEKIDILENSLKQVE